MHRPSINFVILETSDFTAAHVAYQIAGWHNRQRTGAYWLPSVSHLLTTSLAKTLSSLAIPYTVRRLGDVQTQMPEELAVFVLGMSTNAPNSESFANSYRLLHQAKHVEFGVHRSNKPNMDNQRLPYVLGIGSEGAIGAFKFGILSGRHVVTVPDWLSVEHALAALPRAASFFVAPGSDLSADALRAFYAVVAKVRNRLPVGFFYPFGELERDYFMLKAFIYSLAQIPDNLPFNFLFPLEPNEGYISESGSQWGAGRFLTAEQLSHSLERPSEFLAATAHSNGVDMSLGEVVLCARSDDTEVNSSTRVMPCFKGAECSRKTVTNHLLRPSKINSIVTMLYTCWGAVLKDHIYDPRSSLLFDLVKSPTVCSITTTYSSALMDNAAGLTMAERYAKRHRLGHIVRDINLAHFRKFGDAPHALILFGDPEFCRVSVRTVATTTDMKVPYLRRLQSRVALQAEKTPLADAVTECAQNAMTELALAALAHVRAVLAAHRALNIKVINTGSEYSAQLLERLYLGLTRYMLRSEQRAKHHFDRKGANRSYRAEMQRFQSAFFGFYVSVVCNLGGLLHLQSDGRFRAARAAKVSHRGTCPYCHSVAAVAVQEMVGHKHIMRKLVKCDNCAVISDGSPLFENATIDCDSHWEIGGNAKKLKIRLDLRADGHELAYLAGVVLEPFLKRKSPPPFVRSKTGIAMRGATQLIVEIECPHLPPDSTAGCFFLNALVCLGEHHIFLRRSIYLHQENLETV